MLTFRPDEQLKLREGAVAWQQVDDETILLDLKNSRYIGVNSSGSVLWPALVAGTTPGALVERLRREFDLSEAQAVADVDAFLSECAGRELLD